MKLGALQRGFGWLCAMTVALTVALSAGAAPPRELAGTVSKVTDGDSLWLQPSMQGKPVQVRLVDIDAPEICQAWGPQARDALKALVEGQQVTLRTVGVDEYGRMLGTVLMDGLNVNTRLVEEGHAWSARGRSDRGPLVKQERMAKALSRGLWREGGAVMPKDFRRTHGACVTVAGAVAPTPAAVTAPPSAVPSVAPSAAPSALPALQPRGATAYRCDGRTYCSQMSSCAEATYFLRNCPGVDMDGDRDGVPCEQQWCGR